MQTANLAVRLMVEIGALVALAYWGWKIGDGGMRWALPLGSILAAIAVWLLSCRPIRSLS